MENLDELFETNKRKAEEDVDSLPPHKFLKVDSVDIEVEGKVLVASKQVLIEASPVFRAMLTHKDFKEARDKKISLPGKKERDVVMLLAFLTPKADCETVLINARSMLPYADEYEIQHLAEECERSLLAEIKDRGADLEHVYLADRYSLPVLLAQSKDLCSRMLPIDLIRRSYSSFLFYHQEQHPELMKTAEPIQEIKESVVASFVKSEHIISIYSKGRVLVPEVRYVKQNFNKRAAEGVKLCELISKFIPMCNCVPHTTSKLGEESAIVNNFSTNLVCTQCEDGPSFSRSDSDDGEPIHYPVNHSVRYYVGQLFKLLKEEDCI